MAIHSSVLAWRIPGMVEPGGLPSMGSHRVGHDWSDLAAAAAAAVTEAEDIKKRLQEYTELRLALRFLHDSIHVSMPFSRIIPPSLSLRVQKSVLYICVSFAVSHTSPPFVSQRKPPINSFCFQLFRQLISIIPEGTLLLDLTSGETSTFPVLITKKKPRDYSGEDWKWKWGANLT